MSRPTPVLMVFLAVAAGAAWYLLRSDDTPPREGIDLGPGLRRSATDAARGAGAPAGVPPGRGATEAPSYFEIALEGAQPLHTAIQARATLRLAMPGGGERLSGAAVLDALAAKIRVRFASAADAAEFRTRSGHAPIPVQGDAAEVSIDMYPILIDAMGFIPGEQDGVLFIERPTHVVHDGLDPPR